MMPGRSWRSMMLDSFRGRLVQFIRYRVQQSSSGDVVGISAAWDYKRPNELE